MNKLIIILTLIIAVPVYADTDSHRKAADDILNLALGEGALKAGFALGLNPMVANMKKSGMPDDVIEQVKGAFMDWLEEDFLWDDMKPLMIDLYVKEFTESELVEILNFYHTPTGMKSLTKLPILTQEAAKIGQDYAQTKQVALLRRIQPIINQYELDKAARAEMAPAPQ